jgi:hypothetical protein
VSLALVRLGRKGGDGVARYRCRLANPARQRPEPIGSHRFHLPPVPVIIMSGIGPCGYPVPPSGHSSDRGLTHIRAHLVRRRAVRRGERGQFGKVAGQPQATGHRCRLRPVIECIAPAAVPIWRTGLPAVVEVVADSRQWRRSSRPSAVHSWLRQDHLPELAVLGQVLSQRPELTASPGGQADPGALTTG